MKLSRVEKNGKYLIELDGILDAANSAEVEGQLLFILSSEKNLCLDLSKLSDATNEGLRPLLVAAETAKKKGGSLTLVNVSSKIMQIFKTAGFAALVTIR